MLSPSDKLYQSLLVTSNLVFIWPVVEAIYAQEFYVGVSLLFTMLFSIFYHICGLVEQCHFGNSPRTMDFIFATNAICLVALYWSGLTNLRRIGYSNAKYAWAVAATLSLLTICVVSVIFGNFDSYVYMAVILASIGVLFLRFVIFAPEDASDDLAVRGIYRLEYFIMTAILGVIGILLFYADAWISFPAYDETHPFWHVLIGATFGLAIRGIRYRDQYDALRKRKSIQAGQTFDRDNLIGSRPIRSVLGPGHSKDDYRGDEDLIV